jgi:type II secretory pathway component GspD/PulD (secretin)
MVFHGTKWGWRGMATRLLLAPVIAAGVTAPAVGQTASPPAASRSADPAALLRQGREALKAGKLDVAQDLARQADAANPSGRWGLWGDTPESLANDIRAAQAKAGKAEAERMVKAARDLYTKPAKTAGERLANLDQAYALCDRAVGLMGTPDFLDSVTDVFTRVDRPDALKKEIDAARLQLRRTNPNVQTAASAQAPNVPGAPKTGWSEWGQWGKEEKATAGKPVAKPTLTPPAAAAAQAPTTPAARGSSAPSLPAPSMTPPAQTVAGTPPALPTVPAVKAPAPAVATAPPATPVTPAKFDAPPVVPPPVVTAPVSTAKADAAKLVADGRALLKANKLAEARAKAVEAQRLTVSYTPADDTPDALLRDVLADGKKQLDELATAGAESLKKKDFARAEATLAISRKVATDLGFPTAGIDEQLAAVKAEKAGKSTAVVAGPPVVPAVPALPTPTPTAPAPLAVTLPATPVVPTPTPAVSPGREMLTQAQNELRRGELEAARRLATQAHTADPAAKEEAVALLRMIDAEDTDRKRKDAAGALTSAADAVARKQYDQAAGVLRQIDTGLLTPEQKAQHARLAAAATDGATRIAAAPVAVTQGAALPAPAVPQPGLSDQVKAMADVEFQKLRSEGLETESKAQQAFASGSTDVAIALLTDFQAKVKASSLSASRQGLLLSGVERRLSNFRLMKRQTDYLTAEAAQKKEARDLVVGKQLADQKLKEELARKVREVNQLSKEHKYEEAERLALQLKTLDPNDEQLNLVYELAKRQRRKADYDKLKADKEQFYLDALNAPEKMGPSLDINDPIHLDVNRALIAQRRGKGNELYSRSMTPTEREIELRLDKPLSIDFRDITLRDAIKQLRDQTGLNISIDEASIQDEFATRADAAGGASASPLDQVKVSEGYKDLSLKNVLALVLDKARLKYKIENDVIRVTTEKRAKGALVMKVFSVMDLVTPIPDYQLAEHQDINKVLARASNPTPGYTTTGPGTSAFSPNAGMGGTASMVSGGSPFPGGGPAPAGGSLQNINPNGFTGTQVYDGPVQTARAAHAAKLQSMVKMVRPYSWQEMGGSGSMQYFDLGGALVVNQTADIIREVEDLLESLRRLQETSVAVEIRVISLSEAFFERVGVDFSLNVKTKNTANFERSLTTGQFRPEPFINDINTRGVVTGWNPAGGGFTPDLDVPIRATSYPLSAPPFGGYSQNLSPTLNGGLSVGLAFLNDVQVFMFMEAAQGDRRVNIMQAPKITLFNGQTATVFVSDVAFFTLGLQVINVGGQTVYVPSNTPVPIGNSPPPPGSQIGNAQPGVSVTVQAIVSADRRFVRLNLAPTLTALTSAVVPLFPVTAFITPVFEGGSQGVPIPFTQFFQQPTITEIQVQTTVACPDGGTVVLGGLKTLAEGRNEFGPPVLSQIPYINRLFRNQGIGRETRHIMIMVTPRIIIQSEEEASQTGGFGAPGQLPPPAGQ